MKIKAAVVVFCLLSWSTGFAQEDIKEKEPEFKVETVKPQAVMSIRFKVAANSQKIIAKYGQSMGAVFQHLKDSGVQPSGPPFGRYHAHNKNEIDLEVGFPLAEAIAAKDDIKVSELPGGKVVTTVHVGPFTQMSKLHKAIQEHVRKNGLKPRGGLWESILVGPYQEKDPKKFKTKLYLPVQDTEPVPEKAAGEETLHTKLLGEWAFAGKPDSTGDPKPNAPLKFFGLNNVVIVRADPETGEVINCHGGTYTLKGNTYTETVKFGNATRKFLIGQTVKFKVKVDGDVLIQEGIGNNFNERWVRQKPRYNTSAQPPVKSFKSGGLTIRYREAGNGPTVVLAHGIGANSKEMWPVSSKLTEAFHVVSVDQRGFGESDKPKTADDYGNEMVNDLVRLLDHLEKDRAHFVGFSMGAAVVAKLAVSHPNRVLSATVAAPAPIIRPRREVEKLVGPIADALIQRDGVPLLKSSWPEGVPLPPPSVLESMSEAFFKDNDPAAMAACVRGGPELSTEIDERRECRVPFLAVVGSRDKVAAADLKLFMSSIPKKKFVEVKDRGHDLPTSNTFWDAVDRFLRDNASPHNE